MSVWQAWVRADRTAVKKLPPQPEGAARLTPEQLWPRYPDPFTVRRAIREVLTLGARVGICVLGVGDESGEGAGKHFLIVRGVDGQRVALAPALPLPADIRGSSRKNVVQTRPMPFVAEHAGGDDFVLGEAPA